MSGPIKFRILAIVIGIKKSRYVCFVKKLCSVQSIHTELAKLYSQKVIYCLANLAALFDIGHAPKINQTGEFTFRAMQHRRFTR